MRWRLWSVVSIAFALGGCAEQSIPATASSRPPLTSPGPAPPAFYSSWHASAFGAVPATVVASRVELGATAGGCFASPYLASSSRRYADGLLQIDQLLAQPGERLEYPAALCVLHYASTHPLAQRTEFRSSPRTLPSGVVEDAVFNTVTEAPGAGVAFFFLAQNILVMAYGRAIGSARAWIASSGAAPPPLPMMQGIYSWQAKLEPVRWQLEWDALDGRRFHWMHYEDEFNARVVEVANRGVASRVPSEVWRDRTEVFVVLPPARRDWMR